MKLLEFHNLRPINHPLCPDSRQGFVVGSRGVLDIETDDGLVVFVMLVTGIEGENTENTEKILGSEKHRLMLNAFGAGEVSA